MENMILSKIKVMRFGLQGNAANRRSVFQFAWCIDEVLIKTRCIMSVFSCCVLFRLRRSYTQTSRAQLILHPHKILY